MGDGRLSVVVAEDVMLTREGIVNVLRRADIDVIGQAGDADQLLAKVAAARPDVVLTDIRMPPTHTSEGLEAARRIRAEHPEVGVLVLSQYIEPRYALDLISDMPSGAGYLLKERVADGAVLADAVRRVAEGECVVDPTIVARLVGRRRRDDPLERLTAREREVLSLMAEGRSNAAIAGALFVTPRTVEAHTTQIFEKLGIDAGPDVHRRILAVLEYLRDR